MPKLVLDLERLAVETFDPTPLLRNERGGTVHAQSGDQETAPPPPGATGETCRYYGCDGEPATLDCEASGDGCAPPTQTCYGLTCYGVSCGPDGSCSVGCYV